MKQLNESLEIFQADNSNNYLSLDLDSVTLMIPNPKITIPSKIEIVIETLTEKKQSNNYYIHLDASDLTCKKEASVYVFDKQGTPLYTIEKSLKSGVLVLKTVVDLLEKYSIIASLDYVEHTPHLKPPTDIHPVALDMGEYYMIIIREK